MKQTKVDQAKVLAAAEANMKLLQNRVAELAEANEHLEQLVRKERAEHEQTRRSLAYANQETGREKDRVRSREEHIQRLLVELAGMSARAAAFEFTLRLQSRYPVEPAPPKGPPDMGMPINGAVYDAPMNYPR